MSERRTALQTWGTGERERSWWRRGYDPIGRHTMVAAVLGVALAALIGATLDPLNLRTADDLRRAEEAAFEVAFGEIEPEGYADGLPYGEVQQLGALIVGRGQGAETAYGQQFSDAWRAGWNEALAAMRAAAEAQELPSNYTEFRVLDATPSRE